MRRGLILAERTITKSWVNVLERLRIPRCRQHLPFKANEQCEIVDEIRRKTSQQVQAKPKSDLKRKLGPKVKLGLKIEYGYSLYAFKLNYVIIADQL